MYLFKSLLAVEIQKYLKLIKYIATKNIFHYTNNKLKIVVKL